MRRLLRWLSGAIGLALFGSIAYYLYSAATAERRVTALCAQLQVGQSPASANAFFKAHGFHGALSDQDGVRYLVEIRTFGRYGGKVTVKDGVIRAAEFTFAD